MGNEPLHTAMLHPETYPEKTGPIEFRETHVSRLYFTDRHVYKVKKPVDFGFLNFMTLDRRRFYCHEEVRLNRRFCPGTYLGVVDIRRSGQKIRVAGEGSVLDYAVFMERLPEDRMLNRLLEHDQADLPEEMERLARRLAQLHGESPICRRNGGTSNLEVVRLNWRENFDQTAEAVGETLAVEAYDLCKAYVEQFLDTHSDLFLEREEKGFVREGHGDLHADHICLTEPIRIYDCIEFNRRFRVADIASDLAFLLMDLELRGRHDLSTALLSTYLSHLEDRQDFRRLLPFYKLYRAYIRGKVESFLGSDRSAEEEHRRQGRQRARRFFNLALAYLCPPSLIITCGLMGTGKTTLAGKLAELLQGSLLRSDILRKKLAGIEASDRSTEPFGRGIYSKAFTKKTYDGLLEEAMAVVKNGRTAVVDASFADRRERELFRQAALRAGVPFLLMWVKCDEETALDRLDRREAAGRDASDGRRELYRQQVEAFDPVSETEDPIRVDTRNELDYTVHFALVSILQKAGIRP